METNTFLSTVCLPVVYFSDNVSALRYLKVLYIKETFLSRYFNVLANDHIGKTGFFVLTKNILFKPVYLSWTCLENMQNLEKAPRAPDWDDVTLKWYYDENF